VLAHLLLARIAFQLGEPAVRGIGDGTAVAKIARLQTPVLAYQAHFSRGQLARAAATLLRPSAGMVRARRALETLRSRCTPKSEDLFRENRLQVYESLVDLHLSGGNG